MKLNDEDQRCLLEVVKHFESEDRAVRERQIRTSRRLKLFWEGFQRIWYDEVAHDWRIADQENQDFGDQAYYDKPVNVFRAYLESIIAALSVTVPPIQCHPDDADNDLDRATAKAGDKISKLIFRHNNAPLLWLHALFVLCTEGMVACYSYEKEDEKYGTYQKEDYEENEENHQIATCPICGMTLSDVVMDEFTDVIKDRFNPDDDDARLDYMVNEGQEICPNCAAIIDPDLSQQKLIVTRLVGSTTQPKTRICMEVYGNLYIKVANYAKSQAETPYLGFAYETHFSNARNKYPDIWDKIGPGSGGLYDPYERWGRLSPQYFGEYPINNVTISHYWLRPSAFDVLETKENADRLRKKFPNGAKVTRVNQDFAEACNESLDDCWTLTHNPLSDFLNFDPLGMLLTSIQEITNDLVSLIIQTIEHGIPQTFVDPNTLDFEGYSKTEATPGSIYPAKAQTGKALGDSFYEVKTATLSSEIMPFAQSVQQFGQLVSGALPSIFGGQLSESKTASVYSMSRTQALQRLQNSWQMLVSWWKEIFGKAIPAYIKCVEEDERYVEKVNGDFINVFIRKAELEGKIGSIELEGSANLPITFAQMRDVIMNLMQSNNPQILQMLATPENLPLIYDALGITNLSVPGEDDRDKQYEEIKILLQTEPLANMDPITGQPVNEPSVDVDQLLDNHNVHFMTCKQWATSEAGRLAKVENEAGYQNVLLHAKQHFDIMQAQMQPPPMPSGAGNKPLASPKANTSAPIQGENNVQTVS